MSTPEKKLDSEAASTDLAIETGDINSSNSKMQEHVEAIKDVQDTVTADPNLETHGEKMFYQQIPYAWLGDEEPLLQLLDEKYGNRIGEGGMRNYEVCVSRNLKLYISTHLLLTFP
jgi:hypothetical protein